MKGNFLMIKPWLEDGFTLAEILVALAILGLLIPPVVGLFIAASTSNQRSIRNTVALTVAKDIMDRIKTGNINIDNRAEMIGDYKAKYKVEILISGLTNKKGNTLNLIRIYVAPKPGMDPKSEGIMLASYVADVYTDKIKTTGPNGPESNKEGDR